MRSDSASSSSLTPGLCGNRRKPAVRQGRGDARCLASFFTTTSWGGAASGTQPSALQVLARRGNAADVALMRDAVLSLQMSLLLQVKRVREGGDGSCPCRQCAAPFVIVVIWPLVALTVFFQASPFRVRSGWPVVRAYLFVIHWTREKG